MRNSPKWMLYGAGVLVIAIGFATGAWADEQAAEISARDFDDAFDGIYKGEGDDDDDDCNERCYMGRDDRTFCGRAFRPDRCDDLRTCRNSGDCNGDRRCAFDTCCARGANRGVCVQTCPGPDRCSNPGTCGNYDDTCERDGACCLDLPGAVSECVEISKRDCEENHHIFFGIGSECDDTISKGDNGALDCQNLAVTMDTMSAHATANGVAVRWTTAMEIDTVGFRVLRETIDGNREKRISVATEAVPSAGVGTVGASYEFFDSSKEAGRAINYYLEDIDIYGRVMRHGKIEVVRPSRQVGRQR